MQIMLAITAQLAGLLAALLLTLQFNWNDSWIYLAVQAASAALFSRLLMQPRWWIPIHLLFLPFATGLLALNLPPSMYLAFFILMMLVFWGTVKGDVPLFLSSPLVADTLEQLVEREQASRLAELGAGIGSVALPLAQRQPLLDIDAWEKAPLPWAILATRGYPAPNLHAKRSSFWHGDLSQYGIVFAFLSPLAMPLLKTKAHREMRPGTLLVSSSFPVPEWVPEQEITLDDARNTHLYCYRIE